MTGRGGAVRVRLVSVASVAALAVVFALPVGARPEAAAGQDSPPADVTPREVRVQRVGPGVTFERVAPLLADGDFYTPPTADDRLEPADEIAFARALSFVQTRRIHEGLVELRRLAARYPASRRVVSATASTLTLAGNPEEALRFVDDAVRRRRSAGGGRAGAGGEDAFARERAEALLAQGKRPQAIPWMVAACAEPGLRTFRMRRDLVAWAVTADLGPRVVEAARKRSDAAPEDIELALLAVEIECRAGSAERAWPRLLRAEARGGSGRRGELLRVVAERLSVEGMVPGAPAVAAWLELARGAGYDADLRGLALERLLTPVLLAGPGGGGAARADAAQAGAGVPTADLEGAWRSLPAGEVRARLGLRLVDLLRGGGDEAGAQRVIAALGRESTPPELLGELDLAEGRSAVQRGDLVGARRLFARARALATAPDARDRAEYALAETHFHAGEFDSALAAFDSFATARPQSPLANDALERAYLLETEGEGGAGRAAGLATLSRGFYAEARGRWEEAAGLAREAETEARAAHPGGVRTSLDPETIGGPSDPVRAHALLLLSRAEERRGAPAAALAAALIVADSLPGDRLAPLARNRAGDLLLAQGRDGEALAQYEEMLARYPRSWRAAEVRRRVTELRARQTP